MDSADRSFLEYGLASGADRLVSAVGTTTTTNLTNSDSCHDWTGDVSCCAYHKVQLGRIHNMQRNKKKKKANNFLSLSWGIS